MQLDFTSPTWRALEQHAQAQIALQRELNDSPALDAVATANKRGRIAAWKELLALPSKANPAQEATAEPPGY